MAGQDKSKSDRIYTKPAKTSKKFSAAGGRKGLCREKFGILVVE